MERLAIVADDLTGAMDTGAQFAKYGQRTVVVLGVGPLPEAEVCVINTDSRDVNAGEAYRRARQPTRHISGWNVYKKIDSTLRGNIGAELDGLLDGLGWGRALVAPAFPAACRTVLEGYLRVDGVLLAESPFAGDPLWPARESHVPTLLGGQTRREVGHLTLAVVERGTSAVVEALKREPAAIVVADATQPGHLRTLALALGQMEAAWLPCGSAGLAQAWAEAAGIGPPCGAALGWPPDARPVLVVAGSRHPMTVRQLQAAVKAGKLELVDVAPDAGWEEAGNIACTALDQGRNVALTTAFSAHREGGEREAAASLAHAAAWLAARVALSGLVLTGGDIARAVCRAVGSTAVHVEGEVQAGVPAGTLIGGQQRGQRVVTKAGGFGDEGAIIESIAKMQGRLA